MATISKGFFWGSRKGPSFYQEMKKRGKKPWLQGRLRWMLARG